jgi:hypothetical protein
MAIEHCKEHEEYLAKVSHEVVRKRLEVFHLKENVMEVLPFICRSFEVKAPFTEYREWLHPLDPVSLDDLKNWFGVPNETAKSMLSKTHTLTAEEKLCAGVSHEAPRALPMMHYYEFESLDHEQQLAVQQTANNLLYGYVDPERALQPPLSGVINYMIAASESLKIFVAPDLIVCPDNVV